MPTTTANLGLTLPTPNVDTGWGGTLNTDFTIIDNLFAGAGTGTSVGLNVGSAKTLTLGGTMILGSGDGTAGAAAPVSIRGAAKSGTNLTGFNLVIDAPNGTGTGGSGSLVFRTAPAGISSTSPNTMQSSMVITSAGNVGIGTSSPQKKLVVSNSGAVGLEIDPTGRSGETATSLLSYNRSGAAFVPAQYDASEHQFLTSTTERMRIDSSGNVGIGITPSAWSGLTALQIKGASIASSTRELSAQGNAYYNSGWKYIDTAAASQYLQSAGVHYWYTAASGTAGSAITFTERMQLDASGNVGIGVSPSVRLDVASGSVALAANFNSTNASGVYVRFQNSGTAIGDIGSGGNLFSGGTAGDFGLTSRSGNLVFGTSSTERMRIASNGAIGLSGANYGTSGQVLTSNGSGGSPSWANAPGISQGTVQTFASSGNSFTGIPSTVKTIVINIAGWDPSADAYIRIGTSSGFDTTSYVSSGSLLSASGTSTLSDTLGFIINANSSVLGYGSIRLTNLSGNYWVCDYTIGSSGNLVMVGGGGLGLSGVLERVQIIPKTGSFAASGSVNINYF